MRCYNDKNICQYPEKNQDWWHKFFGFSEDLINNRKKYQLGPLYLWGPVDSWNLLRFWYGDDFLTTCKTHYLKNHDEHTIPYEQKCSVYESPQF